MVSTLIKHEIKRTARWFGIIALAAVLVVGAATTGAVILRGPLGGLLAGLALIAALALPAGVQLWQGIDLYRTSYTKTGYLTRALPIKGSTIYWVKLGYAYVVALLFFVLSLGLAVVAAIGIANATGGTAADVMDTIRQGWTLITTYVPGWLTALGIGFLVFSPLAGLATYFFAVTVGSEAWAGRLGIGGPLIMWFAYYTVSQIVALIGIFLPPNLVFEDFANEGPVVTFDPLALLNAGGEGVLPMGSFILAGLLTVAAIVWGAVSFDRRVELR